MKRYVSHAWTEEKRKKLREMFLDYATRYEMADALGVSLGAIGNEIKNEQARGNLPKRANGETKRERSRRGITTTTKRPTTLPNNRDPIDEFVEQYSSLC